MDFDEYKSLLITYLRKTEEYEKADIESHNNLPDEDKEEQGYMIIKAVVIAEDKNGNVELRPLKNNTKWRIGDKIRYNSHPPFNIAGTATISCNCEERICLTGMPSKPPILGKEFSLTIIEPQMTSLFISAINSIDIGKCGYSYIKELSKIKQADAEYGKPIEYDPKIFNQLNTVQKEAVEKVLKRPSLFTIQGPPGTGKTGVLSAIAKMYSAKGKGVLVICNSHQAVNNALNKISQYGVPTFKVGDILKAETLGSDIVNFCSMREYANFSKKRKALSQKYGDVIGMTLCGAILNLILHKQSFTPSIVLIDEASQIPLCQGAAIGALDGGTYIFIGDERQMPPIFHENMVSDPLSISIFDHLQRVLPKELKTTLTTTYRMNGPICKYVSEQFYEPYGVTLDSHPSIADNHVPGQDIKNSIEFININSENCKDLNIEEAQEAVKQALKYKHLGLEISVITPYRKQVNLVREEWLDAGDDSSDIYIDTVERLQGQDVDVIIISMSVSDIDYYRTQDTFLLNRNRLNVMISRARVKVVIIKSPIIPFNYSKPLVGTN